LKIIDYASEGPFNQFSGEWAFYDLKFIGVTIVLNVIDILTAMNVNFSSEAAVGLDLVFQFDVDDGENHYLVIRDGACQVKGGDYESPNVIFAVNTVTLEGITTGAIDGMQAFMGGQLRVEGDMMLALKLGDIFPV
jgi:putative sterol carrier protein